MYKEDLHLEYVRTVQVKKMRATNSKAAKGIKQEFSEFIRAALHQNIHIN